MYNFVILQSIKPPEKMTNTIIRNALVFSMNNYVCIQQSSHNLFLPSK